MSNSSESHHGGQAGPGRAAPPPSAPPRSLRGIWADSTLRRGPVSQARLARYGLAVVATAIALALTLLFRDVLARTLFLFFYAAVATSALFGGLGPGLIATALSVLLIDYYFIPPLHAVAPASPRALLAFGVFGTLAAGLSWLRMARGAERRRSVAAQDFMLHASRVLASSLDLRATLRHVTALAVPHLADYCVLYFRNADGSFRVAAWAHVDATREALLEELSRFYRPDLENPGSAAARVLRTTKPILASTVSDEQLRADIPDPEVLRIVRQLGPVSYLVVPLVARGELLGTLVLSTSVSGRRYDATDLTYAELFGTRAAFALDNARLYSEARRAHEGAVENARLQRELLQARLDTLRAQLDPHFLFNALNTLAVLVRRRATGDALEYVTTLAELLRGILGARGAPEVPVGDELAVVEHYLAIERLRFRDRLSVSVSATPEALEALTPSFVLQPLVENAVKHGVARRDGPGQIDIEVRRVSSMLLLEVRDSGPGFPEGWESKVAAGIGLANTRERLERLYGPAHSFHASNAPGGGAVVRVAIPFRAARREPADRAAERPDERAGSLRSATPRDRDGDAAGVAEAQP